MNMGNKTNLKLRLSKIKLKILIYLNAYLLKHKIMLKSKLNLLMIKQLKWPIMHPKGFLKKVTENLC